MIGLLVLLSGVAAPDAVRVVKDADYVGGQEYENGKDRLDLYLPEGAKEVPVVVFFHGGGLRQGDKSEGEHVGRALASQGVGGDRELSAFARSRASRACRGRRPLHRLGSQQY